MEVLQAIQVGIPAGIQEVRTAVAGITAAAATAAVGTLAVGIAAAGIPAAATAGVGEHV